MAQAKRSTLIINGTPYDASAILNLTDSPLDEYTKAILRFSRAWLAGESHFVLTTSGSTGKAKSVLLTRKQMLASIKASAEALPIPPRLAFGLCVNVQFIGGIMQIARALHLERPLCIVSPAKDALLKLPKGRKYGLVSVVPLQLHHLFEHHHEHLLQAYAITLIGGAPVPLALEKKLQAQPNLIYHSYGMTESASHVALRNVSKGETTFKTLPGVYIRRNKDACLEVKGAMTNHQWLCTDDQVEMMGRHDFIWMGRHHEVVNTGGIKVNLGALDRHIEVLFESLSEKRPFFTYGIADEVLGSQIVLFLEGESDPKSVHALMQALKSHCKAYSAPRAIHSVSHFVRTQSDKVNKKATVEKVLGASSAKVPNTKSSRPPQE